MDAEFWHERWMRREIGFHREGVHPFLPRFFPALGLPAGSPILVPLCGKSLDMLWLCEMGYRVIGVELSRVAVEEFFVENDLDFEIARMGPFSCYERDQIQIYCGDFFALTKELVGKIAAIYDRASLVALPGEMRCRYAEQIVKFLDPGGEMLLISYDYPQEQMAGPPFSVPEVELCQLFEEHCRIEKIYSEDSLGMHRKMQAAGLKSLKEEAYLLCKDRVSASGMGP